MSGVETQSASKVPRSAGYTACDHRGDDENGQNPGTRCKEGERIPVILWRRVYDETRKSR
jgi:hypothetical protein